LEAAMVILTIGCFLCDVFPKLCT